MFEGLLFQVAGVAIQHRERCRSVQIATSNLHLGLLRSDSVRFGRRTVYSARREADFVMPSPIAIPRIGTLYARRAMAVSNWIVKS